MSQTELNDRVAIVTGGGEGIGLCIAQTFLRAGASVVIAERQRDLKPRAEKFLDAGERLLFSVTDVSKEAQVKSMVERTLKRFGRIDFLINNAGIIADQTPFEKLDYAQWQEILHSNLSAHFLCAKHCRKALLKSGGAIVGIASTHALMSRPDTEAYSASKGGIVALTHSLAMSLAPKVRVNCICPGWIVTDAYQYGRRKTKLSNEDHAQHPAGRVGRPEDIAEMVLYLCSQKAGFITGSNFVIDGGMTAKMIYVE